jgi:anti-anti-sigma factor
MTERDWSEKYSVALSETNGSLLLIRIDEALKAMLERSRELPETSHERQRLDYAMNLLSLLRDLDEKNDSNGAAKRLKKEWLFCAARLVWREQTLKIGDSKTDRSLAVLVGRLFATEFRHPKAVHIRRLQFVVEAWTGGAGRTSMLQWAIQNSDEFTTVWCSGRIVLGDRFYLLKVATFSQTSPEVMLDLSRVNLIDAAGLGALVDLHKRFQGASRKMELRDPTNFVYHVLRITGLDTVFHILRTPRIGEASPPSWTWNAASTLHLMQTCVSE